MEFYLAILTILNIQFPRNHWNLKGGYCGEGGQVTALLPGNDKYFLGDLGQVTQFMFSHL